MTKYFQTLSRLRLIDYTVGLIVLVLATVMVLSFSRKSKIIYIDLVAAGQNGEQQPASFDTTVINLIKPGDMAYNWIGQKTLEIVTVEKEGFGSLTDAVITAKIRVLYDPRTHQYQYGTNPVLVGNSFFLNTGTTTMNGKIINVYDTLTDRYKNFVKKEADITIFWRKLEEWQANALKALETKNSGDNSIFRIKNIDITPAQLEFVWVAGPPLDVTSTIYKDVRLTLHLRNVYCRGALCYFNGHIPLYVGSEFTITSIDTYYDGATHKGFITDISYE